MSDRYRLSQFLFAGLLSAAFQAGVAPAATGALQSPSSFFVGATEAYGDVGQVGGADDWMAATKDFVAGEQRARTEDVAPPQECGAPSIRSDAAYCPEWASKSRITPSSGAPGEIDGVEITACRLRGQKVVYIEHLWFDTFAVWECDYGPCGTRSHISH